MTTTVRAVYEKGVLRLLDPLDLNEGVTVEVTVAAVNSLRQPANGDEIAHRLKAANSIFEWVEATKLLPGDDGGYDILKVLNENRIRSGEGPLTPAGVQPS